MALLKRLFAGLRWVSKSEPETVVEAYLLALEGIDTDALERTVEQFIKGMVEEHNGEFVPTTAQLVRQAAKWQVVLHKPKPKALPAPEPVISEAERKRVAEGFRTHVRKMEAEQTEALISLAKRVHGKTNAEALGDPRSLHDRLNLDRLMRAE